MSVETEGNHHDDGPKEAAVIKESRAVRKYDFWPSFYQNSLSSKQVRGYQSTSKMQIILSVKFYSSMTSIEWTLHYENQDVIDAREGLFSSRMSFAGQCKTRGNACFSTGEFNDAICEYERALSMFCWVEPISADWTVEVCHIQRAIISSIVSLFLV